MYGLASYLYIEGFAAEAAAVTIRADSAAGEAAEHEFVLYLVFLAFYPSEEFIEADQRVLFPFSLYAIPDFGPDFIGKLAIRLEDRDSVTL